MGKIGKNKSVISTSLDNELACEIESRAQSIGKTKGAFLRDLLEDWYKRGAPPVGKLDALVQREALAEDPSKYNEKRSAPPKKKAKKTS